MTTKTKPRTIAARIKHLGPCANALRWAKGYTSEAKAWRECQRGDWMLWLIEKNVGPPESDDHRRLVLCRCKCARLTLPIFEKRYPGDNRVRKCIETSERLAEGEATTEELKQARADAAYATASSDDADAADAAYAAYAAADVAQTSVPAQCADIVREFYPTPPKIRSEA